MKIVRYAGEKGLSIVTREPARSMAGASVPHGDASIVVSLEKMKKFLEISTKNLSVVVEPGMINGKLQKELEFLGVLLPP
ncbi:MAG: FAD-binding protein [Desulfosudis oleivorans]|nr:FAD-binding protein [Desulfosudis oleivorans]